MLQHSADFVFFLPFNNKTTNFLFIQVKKTTTTIVENQRRKREFRIHDFIFISISLLAISIYLIFLLVKRKQLRLPDKMMMSLLLSLFGALICFAFVTTPTGRDILGCEILAGFTQFFFLSSLTWSNAMAISIAKSIYSLKLTRASNTSFILYSVYSFGVPLVCVLTTYILSVLEIEAFKRKVYETEVVCFLGDIIIIYSLFLAPVYLLIILNCFIGVIVMVKVSKSGKIGASQDKNRTKKNVISCFKISTCLGLGWVLLFAATIVPELWPIMQVFVELQGFFIVIANVVGWNCLNAVKTLTLSLTMDKSEAATGQSSSQPTELSTIDDRQMKESSNNN